MNRLVQPKHSRNLPLMLGQQDGLKWQQNKHAMLIDVLLPPDVGVQDKAQEPRGRHGRRL